MVVMVVGEGWWRCVGGCGWVGVKISAFLMPPFSPSLPSLSLSLCSVGGVLESAALDLEALLEYRKAIGAARKLPAGHSDRAVGHACLGSALYHMKVRW